MGKTLKETYEQSFDELHVLMVDQYEALQTSTSDMKKKREDMNSEMKDCLIEAYLVGAFTGERQLYGSDSKDLHTEVDTKSLTKLIFKKFDGKSVKDRFDEYVDANDSALLIRVADTEIHRLMNAGTMEAAKQYAKSTGSSVSKEWVTMGDEKVRDTHYYLEGVTVGLNDEFYTDDGDHATCPGGFSTPENNVNCRCFLSLHK